jgi:hypothetical protein
MMDIFRGVELKPEYTEVHKVVVLDTSLTNFFDIFWSDDAPYFTDTFLKNKDPAHNTI